MTKKKTTNDIVWSGTEPYKGRTVTLSVDDRDHIARNHPLMADQFHAVYTTVEDPDVVYTSSLSENREVSFSNNCGFKYSKLFVKTIIEYNVEEQGKIVTAFPVRSEEGGINDKLYEKK